MNVAWARVFCSLSGGEARVQQHKISRKNMHALLWRHATVSHIQSQMTTIRYTHTHTRTHKHTDAHVQIVVVAYVLVHMHRCTVHPRADENCALAFRNGMNGCRSVSVTTLLSLCLTITHIIRCDYNSLQLSK